MKRFVHPTKVMTAKMKTAILKQKDNVYREICETKELYNLLQKWSMGEALTPSQKKAVKSQLIDICKTIPALAIFLVPFGSIFLAVLIKFLPFNIMPSAFIEK